ncbi:MAG: hypothetical protein F4Y78_06930 [Candidatus Dadabacteria bacterium]|nr:hypothetical protein [Candidatus Dadabacteria bacterium]MYA48166.1 hypothetical protein [Candidatus Dadabacteria bacterium]MYG83229.1 hypothetical protein [Candidatus Dadabacteria bacterium]MYK49678.1 hypothetical protein [Candidatus Dadabacteria bacterium]
MSEKIKLIPVEEISLQEVVWKELPDHPGVGYVEHVSMLLRYETSAGDRETKLLALSVDQFYELADQLLAGMAQIQTYSEKPSLN